MTTKSCSSCGEVIPSARLKAQPNATQCVRCLEADGDVPRLRRYDEKNCVDTHSTLFTHNAAIEDHIDRQRHVVPPNGAFAIAIGDDAMWEKPPYALFATEENPTGEETRVHVDRH
jgi:hypothetical protein